jgi:hypothetical protein
MNIHMQDIQKILKCSDEFAADVYFEMSIDFSECTSKEFREEVLFCAAMLRATTDQTETI